MTSAERLRYLLPPGWASIPLDRPAQTENAINAIVDRIKLDDGQGAVLRRQMRAQLSAAASDATKAGATSIALSVRGPGRVPIPASLVLTYIAGTSTPDVSESWLSGGDVDTATVPAGHVVRRVRTTTTDVDGTELKTLVVDYWLERPSGGLAHLAASTPLVDHANAMTELFDAIVQTAEWLEPGEPSWAPN